MSDRLREIKERYDFLNGELMKNEICSDAETFRKYSKERADLSEIAETYEKYLAKEKEMNDAFAAAEEESDKEMKDLLTAEGYDCKEQLAKINEELKILLLPKDEADEKGCVLEIRAGAGGEEAALFAGVLCRMYSGYCARKRLKMEAVDISSTELGGVKEAVYQVTGKGAYKYLKYESGVHRVQRVPETETQGRIHTSTATVAVLPEAENVEVEINEKDIRVDIFHSGGAGGQNVNKVASAVRITHFPTGIVVTCQDERSQLKNKERAFQVLRSRLYDLYRGQAGKEREENRRSLVGSGDRSERIRTYNYPQSRITDHRIGFSVFDMDKFLAGDLDQMVEALTIADRELLLRES
ncbi:MAG: peptide chain release factor 1 [Clostridiales bacterium]|nr:peptide chain release factor 1 [Clostridiales bacterium]MDY4894702.1 peptide chain release factor 1 [Christensenellaceae bacterium]